MNKSSFWRLSYLPQIVSIGSFAFTKKKQFYLNLKAGRGRPVNKEVEE